MPVKTAVRDGLHDGAAQCALEKRTPEEVTKNEFNISEALGN